MSTSWVPSLRTTWKVRREAGSLASGTFVHWTRKRRFGAVPRVAKWTVAAAFWVTSRFAHRGAMTAFGAVALGIGSGVLVIGPPKVR